MLLRIARPAYRLVYLPLTESYQIKEFKSFNQAERDVDAWVKTFPERYDVIIGIPRSGLYFASYIAIKLGVPLSTPSNFLREEVWFTKDVPRPTKIRKVLLVDDGVGRVNGQMQENYAELMRAFPSLEITKGAIYCYPDATKAVDLFFGFLNPTKMNREEWNIMHKKMGTIASDFDGVLCHDWNPTQYESYDAFIENAEPYLIPRFKIDFVITSREEKFRQATLVWLHKHDVDFGELIMKSSSSGNSYCESIKHKVYWLKKLKPDWFWESNMTEATAINRLAKIPVLCIDTMVLLSHEK